MRYLHYDVFTDRRSKATSWRVFHDARGLRPPQMQTLTNEMNFSESTFVLPAETPGTDVRMRIFTPGTRDADGRPSDHRHHVRAGGAAASSRRGRRAVGVRAQRRPDAGGARRGRATTCRSRGWIRAGPSSARRRSAAARHHPRRSDSIPPRGRDRAADRRGLVRHAVPATSRCARARPWMPPNPTRARCARCRARLPAGTSASFVFSTEAVEPDVTVYSRMFAPEAGVVEDPATGSATGPLGTYLVKHGLVHRDEMQRHRQPAGREDGPAQPSSHAHPEKRRRDHARAGRRESRARRRGRNRSI